MSTLNNDTRRLIQAINKNMSRAVDGVSEAQRQVQMSWSRLKRAPKKFWPAIYEALNKPARAYLELSLAGSRVVQGHDDQWVPFTLPQLADASDKNDSNVLRHDPRTKHSYR